MRALEERPAQVILRLRACDLRDLPRDLPVFAAALVLALLTELAGVAKPLGGSPLTDRAGSPFTESEPLAARIGAVIGVVVVVVVFVTGE